MTKETTPRGFDIEDQNRVVRIESIVLHQAMEADVDARILKRVWIEGELVPQVERATMTVDIAFDLWIGDEQAGSLRKAALTLDEKMESLAFVAEGDLHIAQNADVSRMELALTVTTVNKFENVAVTPTPSSEGKPD